MAREGERPLPAPGNYQCRLAKVDTGKTAGYCGGIAAVVSENHVFSQTILQKFQAE